MLHYGLVTKNNLLIAVQKVRKHVSKTAVLNLSRIVYTRNFKSFTLSEFNGRSRHDKNQDRDYYHTHLIFHLQEYFLLIDRQQFNTHLKCPLRILQQVDVESDIFYG